MAKITVGLTGGIASGKSVATDIIKDLGGEIIDADLVSREVGQNEIAETFPDCMENGILNRRKLRQTVFADKSKLDLLNSIMHPLIVERSLQLAAESSGIAVIVAPLLYEVGLYKYCDKVITVTASVQTRIQRLVERDNIDEKLAYNMISAQTSEESRRKIADVVIFNDGSVEDLRRSITEWWTENIEKQT